MSTSSPLPPIPTDASSVPSQHGERPATQSDAYLLALKQIDLSKDLANLPSIPCSRQALLQGIGGGAVVGAIRFLTSRRPLASSNWAVGAFSVIALTSWEMCRRANAAEQAKMRAAVQEYRTKAKAKAEKLGEPGKIRAPGGILVGAQGQDILQGRASPPATSRDPPRLV